MLREILRAALKTPALWLMAVAAAFIALRGGNDKIELFALVALSIGGAFELLGALQSWRRGEGRPVWGWRVVSAVGMLMAAYAVLGVYRPSVLFAGLVLMAIGSHVHFRKVMPRSRMAA